MFLRVVELIKASHCLYLIGSLRKHAMLKCLSFLGKRGRGKGCIPWTLDRASDLPGGPAGQLQARGWQNAWNSNHLCSTHSSLPFSHLLPTLPPSCFLNLQNSTCYDYKNPNNTEISGAYMYEGKRDNSPKYSFSNVTNVKHFHCFPIFLQCIDTWTLLFRGALTIHAIQSSHLSDVIPK